MLAILVGCLPLLVVEVVLRIGGWGRVSDAVDPFVGFDAVQPLFVPDRAGDRFEIPESRQTFFRPASFAARKPADGFRVFCLGGSTVQGRPYATETAFARWLEISLQCVDPSRRWEVVNCGGVSYASYRLAPILRELLDHQPDLFILYTGHNEFLEDRTYRAVKQAPPWLVATHRVMSGLRTYNLLRAGWVRWHGNAAETAAAARPRLASDVDARLDYRGGLAGYRRDPRWQRDVIRHYEFNLRRMVRMAAAAGVPVILVNPAANLGDAPPFKTAHRDDITPAERQRFEDLWARAESLDIGPEARLDLLRQAIAIDDRHARAHFELGLTYRRLARFDRARAAFLRAMVEDICPLRMLPAMHRVLLEVAATTPVELVDVRALFDRLSEHRIPDAAWFVDHVHPTIRGHQEIADALLGAMGRMGLVRLRPDRAERRTARYQAHLRALPPDYHATAARRLAGLRRWSAGQGFGVRRDR